jgi:hypothetical protein
VSALPAPRKPSLAQRALELRSLAWPGASLALLAGRELQYHFAISPSACGRRYECVLLMKPDSRMPVMVVLKPDLVAIAGGRRPPHVYPHSGPGVSLCLWWPKRREWLPQMKLADTYLAWTAEWLWYFEDWLVSGQWSGGGEHPPPPRSRWATIRRPATEPAAA